MIAYVPVAASYTRFSDSTHIPLYSSDLPVVFSRPHCCFFRIEIHGSRQPLVFRGKSMLCRLPSPRIHPHAVDVEDADANRRQKRAYPGRLNCPYRHANVCLIVHTGIQGTPGRGGSSCSFRERHRRNMPTYRLDPHATRRAANQSPHALF